MLNPAWQQLVEHPRADALRIGDDDAAELDRLDARFQFAFVLIPRPARLRAEMIEALPRFAGPGTRGIELQILLPRRDRGARVAERFQRQRPVECGG